MIGMLPLLAPNPQRGERTIARCHERLARRQKRRDTTGGRKNARYLALERALIGGVCVIYISGVARVAFAVLKGLP